MDSSSSVNNSDVASGSSQLKAADDAYRGLEALAVAEVRDAN